MSPRGRKKYPQQQTNSKQRTQRAIRAVKHTTLNGQLAPRQSRNEARIMVAPRLPERRRYPTRPIRYGKKGSGLGGRPRELRRGLALFFLMRRINLYSLSARSSPDNTLYVSIPSPLARLL